MADMQASTAPDHKRRAGLGQVAIIFAGAMFLFVLLAATVIDLSWYWTNNLRIQRAADAAALAGVVWLPGNPTMAKQVAREEAIKNGYTDGVGGFTVTPVPDPANDRRLKVTISGPVNTFFARVAGINSWPASRDGKADYVLPVPMGSPEAWYGVGYLIKPVTSTSTSNAPGTSGRDTATAAPSGGQWSFNSGFGHNIWNVVDGNDSDYAFASANGRVQAWRDFGLLDNLTSNQSAGAVTGIQVWLTDTRLSATCANTKIGLALSWDGGTSWTTTTTQTANLTTSQGQYPFGGQNDLAPWGGHTWTGVDLTDANFRIRATSIKGCPGTSDIRVDMIEVQAWYNVATTTTSTTLQPTPVTSPTGGPLAPQNFWGAMQSQGAPNIQGDAFMTRYATRTSTLNVPGGSDPDAYYDPVNFYNYAVEIPAGASNGTVWIFDPGFCDGTSKAGTGEYWTVGGANGYNSRRPVTSIFDLWDTRNTLFDTGDDTLVRGTGGAFSDLSFEDKAILTSDGDPNTNPTSGISDCSNQSWHYDWYQLATGLAPGLYRLHSYSTGGNQDNTTALNAFAFYASAAGGSPRVYGLGAMEAYVRLPTNKSTEFYLAQIDAVHAGKTMVINLWDPGDTGSLAADLQILQPTGGAYAPVSFDYQGTSGTGGSSPGCGSRSGTATSITTNTGGTSLFNGCWLTIEVQLPATYSAPVDPVSGERGWWKIRYTMRGGNTGDVSTDLTTWKVDIRGNPVHLVLP